jgi:hypothetical protein
VLIRCCGDVAKIVSVETCFVCEARYPVTAVIYLLISRSLPSNGSTRYNILSLSFTSFFSLLSFQYVSLWLSLFIIPSFFSFFLSWFLVSFNVYVLYLCLLYFLSPFYLQFFQQISFLSSIISDPILGPIDTFMRSLPDCPLVRRTSVLSLCGGVATRHSTVFRLMRKLLQLELNILCLITRRLCDLYCLLRIVFAV